MDAGTVRACHDLSEGGLAVAAAEMAIAGGLGMALDLAAAPAGVTGLPPATILFAESPSRFLIEVAPEDAAAFAREMAHVPHARIGTVLAERRFHIVAGGETIVDRPVAALRERWQTPLLGSAS